MTDERSPLSREEQAHLAEIDRLLEEAYEHYFEHGDGHCKSSEGHITLEFGNYWDRHEGEGLRVTGVSVYSYVMGPSRHHYFATLDDALDAVRGWHKREMEFDYTDAD